jgi:hypothetical protein
MALIILLFAPWTSPRDYAISPRTVMNNAGLSNSFRADISDIAPASKRKCMDDAMSRECALKLRRQVKLLT